MKKWLRRQNIKLFHCIISVEINNYCYKFIWVLNISFDECQSNLQSINIINSYLCSVFRSSFILNRPTIYVIPLSIHFIFWDHLSYFLSIFITIHIDSRGEEKAKAIAGRQPAAASFNLWMGFESSFEFLFHRSIQ